MENQLTQSQQEKKKISNLKKKRQLYKHLLPTPTPSAFTARLEKKIVPMTFLSMSPFS